MAENDQRAEQSKPNKQLLALPPATGAFDAELIRGGGVSIRLGRQRPNFWPEHSHAQTQVAVLLDDVDCELTWHAPRSRRIQQRIERQHVWVLPPWQLHSARLGREAKLVVLYLEPAWTRDVTNDVTMHATLVPLAGYIVRDPLIGELSVAFREECRNTTTASHQHTVALGAAFGARLLRAQFPPSQPERYRQRGLPLESLERVKRFIAEHLHEKLPLELLAREARYSPAHFSRLFKRSTGFTTEQYLLRTRLLRAKEFLRMGEFTISEVAYRLGFSDHSHFTTQFKRLFGAPPKVYLARGGEH
jgi:AraC family transcriptional regulator